jgi:hypothetical protein
MTITLLNSFSNSKLPQIETPLAPARPATTGPTDTTTTTPQTDWQQLLDYNANNELLGVSTITPTQQQEIKNAHSIFDVSMIDLVGILAGLVLLGGAVFGFKNVSTTIVTGVKRGAEMAAA